MTQQEFIDYMIDHPIDLSNCMIDDDGEIEIDIPASALPQAIKDFISTERQTNNTLYY